MSDTLKSIANWFETAIPTPNGTSQKIQLAVFLEEVAETLQAYKLGMYGRTIEGMSNGLKYEQCLLSEPDLIPLLDGLCDVIVTAVGVAHMNGLDIIGALQEVDRSNWSKFVDGKPVFNGIGKISKSANYTPPNLEKFVK